MNSRTFALLALCAEFGYVHAFNRTVISLPAENSISLLQTQAHAAANLVASSAGLQAGVRQHQVSTKRAAGAHTRETREGSSHIIHMRMAIIVICTMAMLYILLRWTSASNSLYEWYSTGKVGKEKGPPQEGLNRFTLQLVCLGWKNIKVHTRTQLPWCLSFMNGCCCQMLCPVLYIFFSTAVPTTLLYSSGAVNYLQPYHPIQYGRNYTDPIFLKSEHHSLEDSLFQKPSANGLGNIMGVLNVAKHPEESMWMPQGIPPQGACFCRTLGIVGPGAAEFQAFAMQRYAQWSAKNLYKTVPMVDFLACPANDTNTLFRVFSSQDEVLELLMHYDYGQVRPFRSLSARDRLCGVVVFENDPLSAAVPKFIVRTNITGIDPIGLAAQKLHQDDVQGVEKFALAWYLQSGFLSMQDMVHRFLALYRVGDTSILPAPVFVPLPTAPYRVDEFKEALALMLSDPSTANNVFSLTVMLLAYYMIRERNSKQKELMRLMGLYNSSLAMSWVGLFVLITAVTSVICSALVYAFVVDYSDYGILFMIFFLTSLATIPQGMVVSSLISSERLGTLLAFAAYSTTGMLYYAVQPGASLIKTQTDVSRETQADPNTMLLASLFPNVAFALCMKTYFLLDLKGGGLTWFNIFRSVKAYTVGGGLLILVFDFFLWMLVHVYLDQVVPHGVGTTRDWYFPFTPSFWRECFGQEAEDSRGVAACHVKDSSGDPTGGCFEAEDSARLLMLQQRGAVISVRGLQKTFVDANGEEIRAVNGLSLTMYEGECFCLLGHNGAGKTTAMGMITGMINPTGGEVSVLGHQMPEEKVTVRSKMGFCMQQNVLWELLTVEEHVYLFGTLMGLSKATVEKECSTVLTMVNLLHKQHAYAAALSGGMKRKLNVALALLGDAKVIMLDEPTAGMDPHTRRQLWGVLKQSRAERIMCLTTHYMDEADELGDRICIMVRGKAMCSGTNSFLKQQFGCGYILNFVRLREDVPAKPIEALVRSHCGKSVQEAACVGRELRLRVPFAGVTAFPELMRELDGRLGDLGLESYGVGICDLEDVFLRVACGLDDEPVAPPDSALVAALPTATAPGLPAKPEPAAADFAAPHSGATAEVPGRPQPSFTRQFVGLLQRRVRYGRRDSRMFCCQLLVPTILMLAFISLTKLSMRNAGGQFFRVEIDTHVKGVGKPESISVGFLSSAAGEMPSTFWQQTPVGIDTVHLNASLDFQLDRVPKCNNQEQYAQELAFADYAFDTAQANGETMQFGGLLYSKDHVTIFPNTTVTSAAPALFNMHFSSTMLSARTLGAANAPGGVEMLSQPFPVTQWEHQIVVTVTSFGLALVVLTAYSFIATGISSYIVMEKELEVTHQLMISGTNRLAYWLSNMVFDSIFGLFSMVATVIVLAIFDADAWCSARNLPATASLLLLFTPAVAAFAYFYSHFFQTSGTALVGVLLFGLFLGSVGLQLSFVLSMLPQTRTAGRVLGWAVRLVLPSACVGNGLMNLSSFKDISKAMNLSSFSGHFFGTALCTPLLQQMPCVVNAGDDCALLVIDTVLYGVLLYFADSASQFGRLRKWLAWLMFSADPTCPWDLKCQEDQQVLDEKDRVSKLDPASQILVVDDVCKVYNGTVHAVRGVSFAVEAGSVFGLLGTNGAGKTTTFKMICGQAMPSHGRILVKGKDVTRELDEVRRHIGYCPQFDNLLDLLTVQEHLELYTQVKGYSGAAMEAEIAAKLDSFNLGDFVNSRSYQLSGGNKRKLSCAIAMVGEPEIAFLDEPSAGMDPVARRQMWDVIQAMALRRQASAVILTTHSMEEADALCTRIAIQCSGQLRCLGTPQQLKQWYGTGFEVNLRVKAPMRSEVEDLCHDWHLQSAKLCPLGKARQLVRKFLTAREMQDRELPVASQQESVLPGSLAEWCLQEVRTDAVAAFLCGHCSGQDNVACVERNAGSLRYKLTGSCPGDGPMPYGELFELFQFNKETLQLEDFQISQGTLEQTFNRLAMEDMEREGNGEDEEGL